MNEDSLYSYREFFHYVLSLIIPICIVKLFWPRRLNLKKYVIPYGNTLINNS